MSVRAAPRVTALAVIVALLNSAGCAECARDIDCSLVDVCVDGACTPAPPPELRVVEPAEGADVGDRFDLVVDAVQSSRLSFFKLCLGIF